MTKTGLLLLEKAVNLGQEIESLEPQVLDAEAVAVLCQVLREIASVLPKIGLTECLKQANESWLRSEAGMMSAAEAKEKVLSYRIDGLGLSVRTYNCLRRGESAWDIPPVETLGDLVKLTASQLLTLRNFGRRSLAEVKEKLSLLGLSLASDLSETEAVNADTSGSP